MQFLTHHNFTRTLLSILFGGLFVVSALVPLLAYGQVGVPNPEDSPAAHEQCGDGLLGMFTKFSLECFGAGAANLMLSFAGLFTAMAGWLLNWSIVNTVTLMGEHVNGIAGLTLAWTVLRDFANLVFIFALVFISIATILRIERYGYKQLLKNLIIVAILINFSLVITKVVIDTSNLFATSIYHNILFQSGGEAVDCTINIQRNSESGSPCLGDGLSAVFMDLTRITTLYSGNQGIWAGLNFMKIMVVGIFGSIFLLITSFIFLSAAFLLIIRYVVLIFLMILSPLAFAAYVLPQTQGYASKWWKSLLSQSFFAPFYFLLIWVTVVLMTSSSSAIVGDETLSFSEALLEPDVDAKEIVLNFFIISALMIASLVIAKNMGAYGAGRLQGIGKSLAHTAYTHSAGRVLTYGSDFAGKRVQSLNNRLASSKFAQTKTGRFTRGLTNTLTLGMTADGTINAAGQALRDQKFGGTLDRKGFEAHDRARSGQVNQAERERKSKRTISAVLSSSNAPDATQARHIRSLSQKELEEMDTNKLKNPNLLKGMTFSQIKGLEKSDAFSRAEYQSIKDAHKTQQADLFKKNIKQTSPSTVAELSADQIIEAINEGQRTGVYLSNRQIDAIGRNDDNFTPEDLAKIKTALNNAHPSGAHPFFAPGTRARAADLWDQ